MKALMKERILVNSKMCKWQINCVSRKEESGFGGSITAVKPRKKILTDEILLQGLVPATSPLKLKWGKIIYAISFLKKTDVNTYNQTFRYFLNPAIPN